MSDSLPVVNPIPTLAPDAKGDIHATEPAATPPAPPRPRVSVARQLLTSPRAIVSVSWILVVLICGVFAPWLAPHDPLLQDLSDTKQLPSAEHLLGTDTLGRDLLSRLMYGGASILGGIAVAISVAIVIGLGFGVIAGYAGKWFEAITSRAADALLALPGIVILLMVVAVFGTELTPAMVALGVLLSAQFYRLARAGAREVRADLFVDAARVAGVSGALILARHILPNMIRPIIVQASLSCSMVILMQTGLSFLGLGPPPPSPQWGSLVQEASAQIYVFPWLMVPTGLVITLTALAFNLLGDALADSSTPLAAKASTFVAALTGRARRAARRATAAQQATVILSDALLDVRGITVGFPNSSGVLTVVEQVGFTVGAGEAVALVGESGCGKTITALAIAGLLPGNARITEGQIVYGGRDLAAMSEEERATLRGSEIAFISQEPMLALDPAFSIGSQLVEPLRVLRKLTRAQARVRSIELLEEVGIPSPEAVAKKFPHQLSGGMAQRVAIAIALAGEPRLIVADEPTTALDVTVQAEILELLRSVTIGSGASLIIVTHDWGVVADIASHAVVMYAGQVVESAPSDDVFPEPLHPYTAALLRSAPRPEHAGHVLPTIPGSVPPPAEWPVGCHFQNRCEFVTEACRAAPIPLIPTGPDRESRCIRIDEVMRRIA